MSALSDRARLAVSKGSSLDRRYSQNRTYGGHRASTSRERQSEAYARAAAARARRLASSMARPNNEWGAKSIDPGAGAAVAAARGEQTRESSRIFREEGSGVFGGRGSLPDGETKRPGPGSGWLPAR